mmetsp:Transcript_30225/g.64033  ORF Transcript_30225/g.64033 Transcript_30225/m.64033 type:complete len:86 (-) Transcript_30225:1758-2015(-)
MGLGETLGVEAGELFMGFLGGVESLVIAEGDSVDEVLDGIHDEIPVVDVGRANTIHAINDRVVALARLGVVEKGACGGLSVGRLG